MNKEPIDEMKEQLLRCSDIVFNNTRIITPGEIKQNYLLHVSIKKTEEFIPTHSKIAAPSEDNTIPRVHTAPTLLGCITGFSLTKHLTINHIPNSDPNRTRSKNVVNSIKDSYLGGMYIHKIPFDVAIKPNKNLVFDADLTDETWLITYNEQTRKFPATVIGRIIFSQLVIIPRLGQVPADSQVLLIEITDSEGIRLDNNTFLTEGYWEVHVTDNKAIEKAIKVTKADFDKEHEFKASLLSYKEQPAFTKW